jgi:hypothetical protein
LGYSVYGQERDWVLVSASELDERIRRIRCVAWCYLTRSRVGTAIFMPSLLMVSLILMMTTMILQFDQDRTYISDVEEAWIAGDITDPVDVLLQLEKGRVPSTTFTSYVWVWGIPMVTVLVGAAALITIPRLAPSYHFIWGDYVNLFNRRRAIWGGFYVFIILGIIVSFAGGLMTVAITG